MADGCISSTWTMLLVAFHVMGIHLAEAHTGVCEV